MSNIANNQLVNSSPVVSNQAASDNSRVQANGFNGNATLFSQDSLQSLINLLIQLLQQIQASSQVAQQPSDSGAADELSVRQNYTGPTPIEVSRRDDGRTTIGNVQTVGAATLDDAELQSLFADFQKSDEYPQVETKDLVKAPWGYEGSSSTLNAFYTYAWERSILMIA